MSPNPSNKERKPSGRAAELIDKIYGNFTLFQSTFTENALGLFGSGYMWLCEDKNSDFLTIIGMVNQDSPVSYRLHPVLVLDLWEHAYYLKNQNRRPDYIQAWWNVVNWDAVNELLDWWPKQNIHDEL